MMNNKLKLRIGRIKNIVIRTITTNVFFTSRKIVGKGVIRRNSTNKAIVVRRYRNYINSDKKLY